MHVYVYIHILYILMYMRVHTHAHMGGQTEPVLEIQFKALYVPGKQCTSDLYPCPEYTVYYDFYHIVINYFFTGIIYISSTYSPYCVHSKP